MTRFVKTVQVVVGGPRRADQSLLGISGAARQMVGPRVSGKGLIRAHPEAGRGNRDHQARDLNRQRQRLSLMHAHSLKRRERGR